ncbi:sensor histidine kinase [Actinoplanes sp. DH11]|uniref:sensor histidine kinase n=1 Tax=Actinoplanes sp. DH11 TaxID=2857011 RepID=UPI001E5A0628|nr:histidine kinase [Actinoplanes sp. DH11]
MNSWSRHPQAILGVALGAVTWPVGAAYLVIAMLAAVVPGPRRPLLDGARWLAVLDRRRVNRWLGAGAGGAVDGGRAMIYLVARVAVGLLGALLFLLLFWGAGTAVAVVAGWVAGRPVDGIAAEPFTVTYLAGAAAVLLFLDVQGILAAGRMDCSLARRLLVPDRRAAYESRIAELSHARAEVVAAVDAERRRIERDLHDGVQQRLVALGMLLGQASRSAATVDRERLVTLVRQAHDEAADALVELREVAWRVFPAALDAGGLPAALEMVADRSAVPVTLDVDLGPQPLTAVETVAYFVVCEAVTNAVKHAGAGRIAVRVHRAGADLRVSVHDDGGGGADPAGGGLTGLARRVAALDGRFRVDSPAGGPTVVEAVLPCA